MMVKKRIYLLVLFAIMFYVRTSAQTVEEIRTYFKSRQYDSVVSICNRLLQNGNSDPEIISVLGRAMSALGKYSEAIPHLEKAKSDPKAPLWVKGWSMCELIPCYFKLHDISKAKENLNACLNLNATRNCIKQAKDYSLVLGLDDIYKGWIVQESEHFIFHFQDTSKVNNKLKYISAHEKAFSEINGFFKANLPGKIDFFVWASNEDAWEYFPKSEFAFAKPELCLVHTSPVHTRGHEMTHVISSYCGTQLFETRLINEGIAVNFDLKKNSDNIKVIRLNKPQSISIVEIWKTGQGNESFLYPLGGELIHRLIEKFGRDKFMTLLVDQSYENAKKIYGPDLDELIRQLELEINS